MAAHEDAQKSSSMPSTPQPLMFFDPDAQSNQPTNEEIWRNAKRRRTHRTSSETQFIHMNGYKSDSQVGTRFNNTYVESYTDSKTYDSVQNQSADAGSTPESTPVAELPPQKASEERSEPVSAVKPTRNTRKPAERSTETSSRVLKVKSGSGSSQQTNIQTFIFKTKLDPRLAQQGRSDEPATPSSMNDGNEVQVEAAGSTDNAKPTRKTRKSDANTLKFKSYTPNTTPAVRNPARKPSRQEHQLGDMEATMPTSQSPAMTIDDHYPAFSMFDHDKEASPSKNTQFETPYREERPGGSREASSSQRRSTRARKPVSTIINETPKSLRSLRKTESAKLAKEGKVAPGFADAEMADVGSQITNLHHHTAPSSPVSEIDVSQSMARDDQSIDDLGTPSPESLSAAKRTSGRLRKPTIKAIEALQSKPRSRRRMRERDSHHGFSNEARINGKETPEPGNNADLSAVSMSRSTSGADSEVVSMPAEDLDTIGQQLFELAAAAFADTTTVEEDEAGIVKLREIFNQKKVQQALITVGEVPANEEPAFDIHRIDHLGKLDPGVPLDHPKTPRPWVESDGWTHTGRVNEFGEEYCTAPASRYQWVRHSSEYRPRVGPVPTPPPFIKSVEEIRRDSIFGFPPTLGKRNLSRERPGKVWQFEDVEGFLARHTSIQGNTPESVSVAQGLGRSIVPRPCGTGDTAVWQSTKGHADEMLKKKSLRLVLVDSTKLGHGRSRPSALRKRRQSAPVFAGSREQKHSNENTTTPTTSTHRRRKRSLGDISIDMKDAVLEDADDVAEPTRQRKRRRSTVLVSNNNTRDNTPARQKPKIFSRGAFSTPQHKSNRGTPSGRRGARAVHSERAAHKSHAFISVNQASHVQETPTAHSGRGGRRRAAGTPK